MINVRELLNRIRRYNYILIKTDVPYMTDNFPDKYPIGKDLDIVVFEEEYADIVSDINDFSKNINLYNLLKIHKDGNYRFRFENKNKLHYQIDISSKVNGLPEWFIRESIQNRIIKKSLYYVPLEKYEIVYRMLFFSTNRSRLYHKIYIKDKEKYIDFDLIKKLDCFDI